MICFAREPLQIDTSQAVARSSCQQITNQPRGFMNQQTASNVTPIDSKQQQQQAKFSITCSVDGFPVQVEVEGKAEALRGMIDRLKAIGATPPQLSANLREATKPADDEPPVCEYHGSMRRGNHGYFCPKKMGDGSYCKSKA